ncbi:MAG: hypothetical protein GY817_02975 [bacterium]|nr:hypothetical protein [bacterium]
MQKTLLGFIKYFCLNLLKILQNILISFKMLKAFIFIIFSKEYIKRDSFTIKFFNE